VRRALARATNAGADAQISAPVSAAVLPPIGSSEQRPPETTV
jgi:hypothetical protein